MEQLHAVIVQATTPKHHRQIPKNVFNVSIVAVTDCTQELCNIEKVSSQQEYVSMGLIILWIMRADTLCGAGLRRVIRLIGGDRFCIVVCATSGRPFL